MIFSPCRLERVLSNVPTQTCKNTQISWFLVLLNWIELFFAMFRPDNGCTQWFTESHGVISSYGRGEQRTNDPKAPPPLAIIMDAYYVAITLHFFIILQRILCIDIMAN